MVRAQREMFSYKARLQTSKIIPALYENISPGTGTCAVPDMKIDPPLPTMVNFKLPPVAQPRRPVSSKASLPRELQKDLANFHSP